jgi:hypothetical protein
MIPKREIIYEAFRQDNHTNELGHHSNCYRIDLYQFAIDNEWLLQINSKGYFTGLPLKKLLGSSPEVTGLAVALTNDEILAS